MAGVGSSASTTAVLLTSSVVGGGISSNISSNINSQCLAVYSTFRWSPARPSGPYPAAAAAAALY